VESWKRYFHSFPTILYTIGVIIILETDGITISPGYWCLVLEKTKNGAIMKKNITMDDMLELSIPERIKLVGDLWDSIADNAADAIGLSEEHKTLLNERLAAYNEDPDAGSPWHEVKKRTRGKH
jgi:putative addiction module component (TIGR02574 family)